MDIEQKLVEALERAVAEKRFKNVSALCQEAGVDQGSISTYMRTKKFFAGLGPEPPRLKPSIQFEVASKIIIALGGRLIFPWDNELSDKENEVIILKNEIEKLKSDNQNLDKQLYACEQMRQKFEDMLKEQFSSKYDIPVKIRKNITSA